MQIFLLATTDSSLGTSFSSSLISLVLLAKGRPICTLSFCLRLLLSNCRLTVLSKYLETDDKRRLKKFKKNG